MSDSGIGIPKEKIYTLFKPFSQVSNSLNVNGTGLGLLIVNELIEINKGSLSISSEVNIGTTFNIEFPVIIHNDFPNYSLSDSELNYKRNLYINNSWDNIKDIIGLNILFVDDYTELHYIIVQMFKNYSFKINFVVDGTSALDKIENNIYDLVFLDIRMPGRDGIEILGEIRNIEKRTGSKIPVVALTANALTDDIIKYKNLGFNDVVVKPFTRESILKVITSIKLLNQE